MENPKENYLRRRSILTMNKMKLAEELKKRIFKMDWVFSGFIDKSVLVGMLVWSVYSAWRIFW